MEDEGFDCLASVDELYDSRIALITATGAIKHKF